MPAQPPLCVAMLLCQGVHQDESLGLVSVIGIFEDVHGVHFPLRLPRLCVYAELIEGRGQVPVLLRIVRRTPDSIEGEQVASYPALLDFPHPRHLERFIVELSDVELPRPGEYRVILIASGTHLAERRLNVRGA